MATEQPNQETADAEVLVAPAAVADLYDHLRDQGRQRGTQHDLSMLLGRTVVRKWGSTSARRFNDKHGGGWMVDLSESFDGEELYGIVRSSLGGRRSMVAVVDADELEKFSSTGEWQSSAARGDGDEPEIEVEVGPAPERPGPYVPALRERRVVQEASLSDKDPVLIVITHSAGEKGPRERPLAILRGVRDEVPGIVRMMLFQGVKVGETSFPVADECIEVWSSVSKPKIEVKF